MFLAWTIPWLFLGGTIPWLFLDRTIVWLFLDRTSPWPLLDCSLKDLYRCSKPNYSLTETFLDWSILLFYEWFFIIGWFHEWSVSSLMYFMSDLVLYWIIHGWFSFFLDFLNSVFLFQTSFDYYIMMVFCFLMWRKRSFSVQGLTISGIRVTCHPLVLHQAVVTIQALKHRKAVSLQSHVAAGMVPGFSVHVCDITHGTVFRPAETPHSSMQIQT